MFVCLETFYLIFSLSLTLSYSIVMNLFFHLLFHHRRLTFSMPKMIIRRSSIAFCLAVCCHSEIQLWNLCTEMNRKNKQKTIYNCKYYMCTVLKTNDKKKEEAKLERRSFFFQSFSRDTKPLLKMDRKIWILSIKMGYKHRQESNIQRRRQR